MYSEDAQESEWLESALKRDRSLATADDWCFASWMIPLGNALVQRYEGSPARSHQHISGASGKRWEKYHVEMLTFGETLQVFAVRYERSPVFLEAWLGSGFAAGAAGSLAIRGVERPHTSTDLTNAIRGRGLLAKVAGDRARRAGTDPAWASCADFKRDLDSALRPLYRDLKARPQAEARRITLRKLAQAMSADPKTISGTAKGCGIDLKALLRPSWH